MHNQNMVEAPVIANSSYSNYFVNLDPNQQQQYIQEPYCKESHSNIKNMEAKMEKVETIMSKISSNGGQGQIQSRRNSNDFP